MSGFAVFGVGVEMVCIVCLKTIVKWFRGKELALAMGLEMAIARLGVFAVMWLSPIFANNGSNVPAEWTTANAFYGVWFFLTIGFLTFLIYTFMDVKLDKELGVGQGEVNSEDEFKVSDLKKIFTNRSFCISRTLCSLLFSYFPIPTFCYRDVS